MNQDTSESNAGGKMHAYYTGIQSRKQEKKKKKQSSLERKSWIEINKKSKDQKEIKDEQSVVIKESE